MTEKNLPELTPEEKAACGSIDMTPILGTPSERLQFAIDKAMEYFRRATLAEKEAAMLRDICYASEAELEQARDAIQSVLASPDSVVSEYSLAKLKCAKGLPIPGHRYRVYSSENWDVVEIALQAVENARRVRND